jgi:hypothetical protein
MRVGKRRHDSMGTTPCRFEDTFRDRCACCYRREWGIGAGNPHKASEGACLSATTLFMSERHVSTWIGSSWSTATACRGTALKTLLFSSPGISQPRINLDQSTPCTLGGGPWYCYDG